MNPTRRYQPHDSNHIYTTSSDISRDSSTFPEDINFVPPTTVSRLQFMLGGGVRGGALTAASLGIVEEVSCY
jgi:hypothetical protein